MAKEANAPEEWLCTVDGAIELHAGHPDLAIGPLERALKLNPANASAASLLSFAYVFEGRWDKWAELNLDLEPGNDFPVFDELFLGYANFYIDYGASIERLGTVLNEHPTWLAPRIVRASANSHEASRLGNAELARSAMEEVNKFDVLNKENP
ncbi:MAG: hypothetical protein NXI32_11955 [bacterium]|nr:hypothetical protein [bacterium]